MLNELRNEAMTVRDIMTRNPATCTWDTKIQEVAKMMADRDCGAIPVVGSNGQNNKPIGIITDRDITVRLVAKGQNPLDKTAGDAMTESTVTVREGDDLEQAALRMEENQVRRIVVVDNNNKIVGICAQADLARQAPEDLTGEVVEKVSEPTNKTRS